MSYSFHGFLTTASRDQVLPHLQRPDWTVKEILKPFYGCGCDIRACDRTAELVLTLLSYQIPAHPFVVMEYVTWAGPIDHISGFVLKAGKRIAERIWVEDVFPDNFAEGDLKAYEIALENQSRPEPVFIELISHLNVHLDGNVIFAPFERNFFK